MMTGKGLAKLIEECGELVQVAGKRLAYYTTNEHPDGGAALTERMEDEIADVIAACTFVIDTHGLDLTRINERVRTKHALFWEWHMRQDNNKHGIDAHEHREPVVEHRACKVCRAQCNGNGTQHGRGCYVGSDCGGAWLACDCEP